MPEFEFTGKTVEQAIEEGLKKLKKKREDVEIKILDEGKSGLFGLMGSNAAKVKITYTSIEDEACSLLKQILKNLKIDAKITAKQIGNELEINLSSSKSSILIGREGKTLSALEYILSLILNNNRIDYVKIDLDIENYKKKKIAKIKNFIDKKIPEIVEKGEKLILQPMPSWERRFIHIYLKDHKDIKITSEGEGKFRHIVLSKK